MKICKQTGEHCYDVNCNQDGAGCFRMAPLKIINTFSTNQPAETAIDEVKKQEAIAFAQWICSRGFDSRQILVRPVWSVGVWDREFTSEELYESFKKEQQQG